MELKTTLEHLASTKSRKTYHVLVTYVGDREFKRTFLTDNEVELLVLKGVEVLEKVEE